MGRLIWMPSDTVVVDTDVVIYTVERLEPYYGLLLPLWHAANAGEVHVAGSELLLLETMVKPLRQADTDLQAAFRNLLTNTRFRLIPITRSILAEAALLRAKFGLKTPDSIHAATALLEGATIFLSNNHGHLRVKDLRVRLLERVLTE